MKLFKNIVLPDFINPIIGSVHFKTSIVQNISNREIRYPSSYEATHQYRIKECYLNMEQLEILNGFFRNTQGAAFGFCLKDPADHMAKNQILQVDPAQPNSAQLFKEYIFEEEKYARRIFKPIPGSLQAFVDGEERLIVKVNYDEGKIELEKPVEKHETLSVNFDFYVPVRFETDSIEHLPCSNGSWKLDIKLIEIHL